MKKMSKKMAYAEARVAGKSMVEAAKIAGYSEATAYQSGYRLGKDPAVIGYIATMKAALHKSDPPPVEAPADFDPLKFFRDMANDVTLEERIRLDAAKVYASYTLEKPGEKGEKGKKEKAKEKAVEVSKRFVSAMPPSLRAV